MLANHTILRLPAIGPLGSLALLRKDQQPEEKADETTASQVEQELQADPALSCAVCLHRITSTAERIEQLGHHEHCFSNPQGTEFLIGCFANAQGCENIGDWVSEYSWFVGYLWRYSLCAACHTHLGWQFKSDQDSFFGLIRERLISSEDLH